MVSFLVIGQVVAGAVWKAAQDKERYEREMKKYNKDSKKSDDEEEGGEEEEAGGDDDDDDGDDDDGDE